MSTINDEWIYCTDRLPENYQPVWWAIKCTAGPGTINVHAGTIKNGSPLRGHDGSDYEPDFYHEYIAWKPRPDITPTAPDYQKGILPVRDRKSGKWSLTETPEKY